MGAKFLPSIPVASPLQVRALALFPLRCLFPDAPSTLPKSHPLGEGEEALSSSPAKSDSAAHHPVISAKLIPSDASQLPAVCQQLLKDINNQPLAEAPRQRGAGDGAGVGVVMGREETQGVSSGL